MDRTTKRSPKYRSKALQQLARRRSEKKGVEVEIKDDGSDSDDSLKLGRSNKRSRIDGDGLLTYLPEPVHSRSAPAFDLFAELMNDDKSDQTNSDEDDTGTQEMSSATDMIEVDASKLIAEGVPEPVVATKSITAIKMPKSKEKEKNQITHLARLAEAAQSLVQDKALQGRVNRAAARSKYGWR